MVRHVTTYRYSSLVHLGEHRGMFRPRASHDLRLVETRLDISPAPANLRWLHDIHDNSIAIATFDRPTTRLVFESTVTLEHYETARPDYALETQAQTYPFTYPADELPDLGHALLRHYPGDDVSRWAAGFLAADGSADTMTLLEEMTASIHSDFKYVRRPEKGVQRPEETWQRRAGSCRDFALFMMEAVRSLGLAARFVSGYIFVPEGANDSMMGGGATHAWMQVYLPGAGWVDFDPTNRIVGNRNLIRVAVAWDHHNALPLWGTFVGAAGAFMGMDVSVSVREATPMKTPAGP